MIGPEDVLKGKILIVDDREANVILLERLLRSAGYDSVTSTMDSTKVCELHLEQRFDLILLDLKMPGMDGFQVMENLKTIETEGYLPVLVITAQKEEKLRALKAGAKDFISKPLEMAEVLLRVYNMIEVRLLHLASRQLYEKVVGEQRVSERLLEKLLPQPSLERLHERRKDPTDSRPGLVSESFAEVTVLFSDIIEFTKFSEGASAEVLSGVLCDISARFDKASGLTAAERTTAIGNAYLAGVDLADDVAVHTIRAANKALDLVDALDRFNTHTRYQLKVAIGLDTPAVEDGQIVPPRQTLQEL